MYIYVCIFVCIYIVDEVVGQLRVYTGQAIRKLTKDEKSIDHLKWLQTLFKDKMCNQSIFNQIIAGIKLIEQNSEMGFQEKLLIFDDVVTMIYDEKSL